MTQTTRKPLYRKIGGIHWLALGVWRVSVCRTRGPSRRGWLTLPVCAVVAACSPTATDLGESTHGSYSLVITGASGQTYKVATGLTAIDCDAEIGAWDRDAGDVRCVQDAR